ncbi:MAG: hypothetical protein ACRCSL_16595 [Microbacterium sp.]
MTPRHATEAELSRSLASAKAREYVATESEAWAVALDRLRTVLPDVTAAEIDPVGLRDLDEPWWLRLEVARIRAARLDGR